MKTMLSVLQGLWYSINFTWFDIFSACLCIVYSMPLYSAMASHNSLTLSFYAEKNKS